jgi:hypothetical protein
MGRKGVGFRRAIWPTVLLQQRLAVDFGRMHGWRLSDQPFTAETLARGGVHDGSSERRYDPTFCDHPYWYRSSRHARAIAAHLYDIDIGRAVRRAEIPTWAEEHGLRASFPDYPSWWYPGRTTLVLYEPVILYDEADDLIRLENYLVEDDDPEFY